MEIWPKATEENLNRRGLFVYSRTSRFFRPKNNIWRFLVFSWPRMMTSGTGQTEGVTRTLGPGEGQQRCWRSAGKERTNRKIVGKLIVKSTVKSRQHHRNKSTKSLEQVRKIIEKNVDKIIRNIDNIIGTSRQNIRKKSTVLCREGSRPNMYGAHTD